MRETSVEKRLGKRVTEVGGMSFKVMPIIAGLPDRCVIMPGNRIYFVETKAPGGNTRPAQVVWHAKALRRGVEVYVLWNSKEVDAWVEKVASGDL